MKRYALVAFGLCLLFLLGFALVEALGVRLLTDPGPLLAGLGPLAGVASVALLVGDVFLPVPSSVLMTLNGTLFGVVPGALLSLAGGLGASALGFALGRRGGRLVERLATQEAKARADAWLARWGAWAVLASRPVPLLAETVAILAGASPMRAARMLAASTLGIAPLAFLYAWAGAKSRNPASGFIVFGAVLALAGALWWWGRRSRAPG